jgi:hypothetical protein
VRMPRRSVPSRRAWAWFATAVAGFVVLVPGPALAAWTGGGTGTGAVRATSMPTGPTPSVSVTGRNVTVSWAASTVGGASVASYTVRRYDASTLALQTIGSGCGGTISAPTCTEAAVPAGSWKYSVTPRQGLWVGTEGPKSATATVASASLAWTSASTLTSLPATMTGILASYVTGETVVFRFDDASSGTVLTGSISPSPVPAAGSATLSVTIPAGVANGGHTVYAVGSAGSQASGGITLNIPDTTPPTISAAMINKSTGDTPGYVKQGGQYYVYASVADTGIYASGVATVTANVANITTGATAAGMTAGLWTIGDVSYNYRSAVSTANAVLLAGSKTFTIMATDVANNSTTQSGFSVTVDNTAPTASDIQTTNASGGTNGLAETGDTIAFTFAESIDPNSIVAGWNGASRTITVRLNNGGSSNDAVSVYDSADTTQLPLGSVNLGRKDYTGANITFTSSTMVMSGSTITVTLGTASNAPTTGGSTGSLIWTPSATATDRAGNACSTSAKTETGGVDKDF